MGNEITSAVRALARRPSFAITVVTVLALSIGANAAVFGLIDQVLFAPPGVEAPDRVVAVNAVYRKLGLPPVGISATDFRDLQTERAAFARVAASERDRATYVSGEEPLSLQAARVSLEWFDVFGVRPLVGRTFTRQEMQEGGAGVVVLAHAVWMARFGGDPRLVGRTVILDGAPHTIVGIMPPTFRWPREVELWRPLILSSADTADERRFVNSLTCFARLEEGVGVSAAGARIAALARRARPVPFTFGTDAASIGWGLVVRPFTESVAGTSRRPMLVLFAAVACVLLIACANIAGLMVARSDERTRELAVRAALGAGRARLLRHTLVESLLLSGVAALGGLWLAAFGMDALIALAPAGTADGLVASLDRRSVGFALASALVSALLCALAPAWHVVHVSPLESLKASSRTTIGRRGRQRLRAVLVVGETAAAMVLLTGAGLLTRSFLGVQRIDPGFQPDDVLTARVTLTDRQYPTSASRQTFVQTVLDRLRHTPGVVAGAMAVPLPFTGDRPSPFEIEGRRVAPGEPTRYSRWRIVTPAYFETLRIPLKRGRLLAERDGPGAGGVTVIDERLARQHWPGQDPIGQRLRFAQGLPWLTVVGVVGTVRQRSLTEDEGDGAAYQCLYQHLPSWSGTTWLAVRLRPGTAPSRGVLDQAVRAADPRLPVHRVTRLEDLISDSLGPQRFVVVLLACFATMALVLAGVGLYGIITYTVTQRTAEIGIRMALGADRASVLRLFVGQGGKLAGAGVVAGLAVSMASGRFVASQLHAVTPADPPTLVVVAATLLGTALLAVYVPARRASRIDPVRALQDE